MKRCIEDYGDEVNRVALILVAWVLDLLMFPHRRVSADDFQLILCWIDETCLENPGCNLNIDPIAE